MTWICPGLLYLLNYAILSCAYKSNYLAKYHITALFAGAKSVIRPPFKKFTKGVAFFPFQMGDHVMVGEGSIVNAASVGSYVKIGGCCVILYWSEYIPLLHLKT